MRAGPLASLALVGALTLATSLGAQAPLGPGEETLPPGHPPLDPPPRDEPASQAPEAAPRASAGTSGAQAPSGTSTPAGGSEAPGTASDAPPVPAGHPPMPAGHPPTQGAGPQGMAEATPTDRVLRATELPAGSVEVLVHDGSETPQAGVDVSLVQHRHDVAEGDAITEKKARTDGAGRAHFTGLPTESSFSYTIRALQGGARYDSEEFQLADMAGRRVLQHVYPVEHDIQRVLVGLRGLVFVEPREDVLQLEVSFQVFNIGRQTWVPTSTTFPLPRGAKAFRARDAQGDATVEEAGDSVRIVGTYPPGQREIAYSLQIPANGGARQSIEVALPPHVAELRVASSIGRAATLSVSGFPEAEHVRGRDGSWLAVTGLQLVRGQEPVSRLAITLDGLSTPSRGRWIAVGLAAVIMFAGLASALRRRKGPERGAESDVDRASQILFEELEALEELRSREAIGPRAYDRTRQGLIDALARVEAVRRAASPTPDPRTS